MTKICNILDYGAKADGTTDNGIAITKTFDECIRGKPFTRMLIPEGEFLVKTMAQLEHGLSFAIEIRGRIVRHKSLMSGNVLNIYRSKDVEVFGVNGAGKAIKQLHPDLADLSSFPGQRLPESSGW